VKMAKKKNEKERRDEIGNEEEVGVIKKALV
jgi:hypothetical protein